MDEKNKPVEDSAVAKSSKKKCFIITPVGSEGSDIRVEASGIIEAVLKPLLDDEYEVNAAHLSSASIQITKEIIQFIYSADLVIANLTGSNPNVMYELSLAHALRKPVVHIIREGESIPFDISVHRYISYKNTMLGVVRLKEDLSNSIKQLKETKEEVSNPITDAIDHIKIESKNRSMSVENSISIMINRLDVMENRLRRIGNDINHSKNSNRIQLLSYDKSEIETQVIRTINFLNESKIEVDKFVRNSDNINLISDVLGIDFELASYVFERLRNLKIRSTLK